MTSGREFLSFIRWDYRILMRETMRVTLEKDYLVYSRLFFLLDVSEASLRPKSLVGQASAAKGWLLFLRHPSNSFFDPNDVLQLINNVTYVMNNSQLIGKNLLDASVCLWYLPVPRLNLTPPRMSLCPIRSWSHTVNSRQRSERSDKEMSSQLNADSHLGLVVFRHT